MTVAVKYTWTVFAWWHDRVGTCSGVANTT